MSSTVCVFKMQEIIAKLQKPYVSTNVELKVKEPFKTCDKISEQDETDYLSDMDVTKNRLVDARIISRATFFVDTFSLTSLSVDQTFPQNNIYYFSSSDGRILKTLFNRINSEIYEPLIIQELQVFSTSRSIKKMTLVDNKMIVFSNEQIVSVNLKQCEKYSSCGKCVYAQDPMCSWNIEIQQCQSGTISSFNQIQNLINGTSPRCEEIDVSLTEPLHESKFIKFFFSYANTSFR